MMPITPAERSLVLASLPRLADGAIAYPGREIWALGTWDGGRTWTPFKVTITAVDRMKLMRTTNRDIWILPTDSRHYSTKEAALADIPNHIVRPTFEVAESGFTAGEWLVEAIDHDSDGEIFFTLFSGPDAEERARKYAEWQNG